jgi:hypothetical protein
MNNIPFVVNPYAITAFNSSRAHEDHEIRQMQRDEFLSVFMEITQIGIEACEDFRTVNMYHLANSATVHEFIRDISSYEVLKSKCSARANRLGISIVPADGSDVMKKSVYYDLSVPFDYFDPATYTIDRRPRWLPRFRRVHICDAISLYMEGKHSNPPIQILQADTFFSKLRQLDEQDDFLTVDGYAPLKRLKVLDAFPDMFWKIFYAVFPPYDITCDRSLGLVMRPSFNGETIKIFDNNMEKGRRKFINVSRSTMNILDRMILGYDNIHHDIPGTFNTNPFGTDPAVLSDFMASDDML